MIRLTTPLENVETLRSVDQVAISGVIYTARDAAHQRLVQLIREGQPLPFPIAGAVIYYVGTPPAKPGQPIGSEGPTTSMRMDGLTVTLLELGLKGLIGIGGCCRDVFEAMKWNKAVYFAAVGGAAALIAQHIKEVEVVAYPGLGPEAVRRMVGEDFPVIVAIAAQGNNLYEQGEAKYRQAIAEGGNKMSFVRADGRRHDELRPVQITRNCNMYAEGSVLIEVGNTKVICTATVVDKEPPFLRCTGEGWITA